MSLVPSKTGVPELVANTLATSVDFHIASTNYNKVVDAYINFVALAQYYDSLKYECDPITAEADFWELIAGENIDLTKFAKNPKAITYLKKIDANVPPNQTIKLDKAGNPYTYIDSSGNLVTETTEGTIIPLTENDTVNVQNKINAVSNSFSIEEGDKNGEFLHWWLNAYKRSHQKVKDLLVERMNVEDTILQEVSESIGFLFYQHLYPQSRYTHYADENTGDEGVDGPFPYNSIIDDKIDFDYKKNVIGLSKRADAIFKRNMQSMFRSPEITPIEANPELAHRENLATDHVHYKRLIENQSEINENINTTLGGTAKLLKWLSTNNLNDKQKTVPTVIETVVENSMEEVDILTNKIQTLQRMFSIDVLR